LFPLRLGRAGSLDVTGLLALIANTLLGWFRRAVTAEMANLTTVVAFLPLSAVARHVAVSTARVASLSLTSSTVSTAVTTLLTLESPTTTTVSTGGTSLGAVTSDVSDLAALVAFLASSTGISTLSRRTTSTSSSGIRAVAGDVASLATAVARLLFLRSATFAAYVSFLTTVVAGWGTAFGAVTSLVGAVAAVIAATSTGSTERFHVDVVSKAFANI